MKNALYWLVFGLFSLPVLAQQPDTVAGNLPKEQKVKYVVKFQLTGEKTRSGSLYTTGDSSLVIAKTKKWFYPKTTRTETIPVKQILEVQVKRSGLTGKSVLIGMGIGALIGGIIGSATYEPCVPNSSSPFSQLQCVGDLGPGIPILGGVLIGIPIGALAGGISGAFMMKTYPINGSRSTYAAQRVKLKRLSITGQ